jgi:predicted nucleotide-binding protein
MPATIQEQYDELIRCAEKYIRSPHHSKASAVLRWRGKVMRWLKSNAPKSGLALKFVTTANPADDSYGEGITKRSVSSIQQGLKILHDAEALVPMLKNSRALKVTPETMRKVFIVHGHDDLMKHSAARFVSKLLLEPVILHELPNGGRTIIEKFLDHSEVGFAIVLLSGDDRGGAVSKSVDTYQPRARQNVIFELGFFIGRLDRSKVVALYKDDVEVPSDYKGVLFVPFDKGGLWEIQVAKEMRAAGLKIDLNRL